mmetsp:Transcript_33313/g.78007  ORF Transcript_33313/g.78007 Transcript_33313/m.78007 type:complete len:223 (+) Transcript_33313:55-723(+)
MAPPNTARASAESSCPALAPDKQGSPVEQQDKARKRKDAVFVRRLWRWWWKSESQVQSDSAQTQAFSPYFTGAVQRRSYEEALAASQPRFQGLWKQITGFTDSVRELTPESLRRHSKVLPSDLSGSHGHGKILPADADGEGAGGFDSGEDSDGEWVLEEVWCRVPAVPAEDSPDTFFAGSWGSMAKTRPGAAEPQPRCAAEDPEPVRFRRLGEVVWEVVDDQ